MRFFFNIINLSWFELNEYRNIRWLMTQSFFTERKLQWLELAEMARFSVDLTAQEIGPET